MLSIPLALCQGERVEIDLQWNSSDEGLRAYLVVATELYFLPSGGPRGKMEAELQEGRGLVITCQWPDEVESPDALLEVVDAETQAVYTQWRVEANCEIPWGLREAAGQFLQPGARVIVRFTEGEAVQEEAFTIGAGDLLPLLPRGEVYAAYAPGYSGPAENWEEIDAWTAGLWEDGQGTGPLLRFEGDVLVIDGGRITEGFMEECAALLGAARIPVSVTGEGELGLPSEDDWGGGGPILWLDLAEWRFPKLEVITAEEGTELYIIGMGGAEEA